METPTQDVIGDRFLIEREVGRGAVGVVYRAFDTVTKTRVALKIIVTSTVEPTEQARFIREGQILSELDHPSIVRVVAYGALEAKCITSAGYPIDEGSPYIAMEWLEGEDLEARQKRAPLGFRQSLEIGRQIAFALAAAHDFGVVHRDIKPSNIFLVARRPTDDAALAGPDRILAADEQPNPGDERLLAKLVDFGVAAQDDVRLTKTGAIVGTPAYMAPEQARGDIRADVRSDIYSLGATLFELCAGRPPHIGPTSIATLARLVTAPAPRLSELLSNVPERLDELINTMLQSVPERRPASAREVARELEALCRDPSMPEVAQALVNVPELPALTGTRVVTTLVGLSVASGAARIQELARLREVGADALPLGSDAIVAHLGIRRAHGDEAVRAIEIGKQLCDRGARVGVATGRMRVDKMRLASEAVDRASSLARQATEGGLLVDATTLHLARGRYNFELLPDGSAVVGAAVRGRRDAVTVVHFIGRETEFVSILSAYKRSLDDRTPILVSISGPPGIGKSRLTREFATRIRGLSEPPQVAQVRCESFRRAQALGVATDALRAIVGLPKGASLEQAEEALRARRLIHNEGNLLARLLADQPFSDGLDPHGTRDALYLSMTELVLAAATERPCALVLEDAQWSDPESMAWIEHLLGRATDRPLFVLMNMRPSFWREQAQRFKGRDHVRVELRPMARRAMREIARSVLGSAASDSMLDQVAQQAAGSPLFAEELARAITTGKSASTAPTIEAAIQVSLDALDDNAREAVVRMSVFGQSVWVEGALAVGVGDPDSAVKRLVASEMLVEHATSRFAGTREFMFKHALVRDVAYATASEELRKKLHAAAATWLDAIGEDSATVAQHFDLGGEHEKAAAHWEAAARHALATNSLSDAVVMADKALVFAPDRPTAFARAMLLNQAYSRLDARSSERDSAIRAMDENVFDEESELLTTGARARYDDACGSGSGVEERLIRVRQRAYELDLADEQARCSATLAQRYAFAGELDLAMSEAEHLIDLAERKRMMWAGVDAWQTRAVVHQARGELAAALEARRSAVRTARSAGLQEREAMLTMNVGFALTTIGARQEALQEIEAGIAKARAIGSAGAVRHGQMILLCWAATFEAEARLSVILAEPRASADEAAAGVWVVRDRATLGVLFYRGCELLRGDAAGLQRARQLLKIAAEAYRSTENHDVLPVALGFWAEAERRFGNAEHAIELASEAASLVERGAPSLLNEAPIFLALHDALVDSGDLSGAREAMANAFPPLIRRLKGLEGTPYARQFLVDMPHNENLLSAAETYGLIPIEIEEILNQRPSDES